MQEQENKKSRLLPKRAGFVFRFAVGKENSSNNSLFLKIKNIPLRFLTEHTIIKTNTIAANKGQSEKGKVVFMANEKKVLKRVGVLTSGGDAPGMNAVIRSVVRTCAVNNIQTIGIKRGYNGLLTNDFVELNARSVNGLTAKGGTMLYTARSKEFATPEGVKRAAENCRYMGIDGIVCIGGDGTFRGARDLSAAGVNTVAVPATIDNDISCTEYTIGFDTACNTAIDAIDKLSDTMQSHERISVVEVMGRNAGHLALYVACAVGATAVLLPERGFDIKQDVVEKVRAGRLNGRNHFIVIVAEGVGHATEVSKRIQEETGMETRLTILGHVQRGGSPNGRDRVTATEMGHHAVEALLAGKTNIVVAYRDDELVDIDIDEALSMKKSYDPYRYRVISEIAR